MRLGFSIGVLALVLFELANVWFIMPLPFSQRVRSIDIAYALYTWRWAIRGVCAAILLAGVVPAWRTPDWRRWLVPVSLVAVAGVVYAANMVMAADHMFLMPSRMTMVTAAKNSVERNRLVVGIVINGDARAYPVRFIGYHHQVRDTVGGEPVLVTFCTACRTGRVYSPVIGGRVESTFRLVGMDHFNAMLEDGRTHSWWRQSNGAAIAGPRTGDTMREIPSQQVTLALWLEMHPHSKIMQADSSLIDKYSKNFDYETGTSSSKLTGTDSASWHDKSWVVGVEVDGHAKAYDWNQLRRERVLNDVIGAMPIVVIMASDNASYFAFARPDTATRFTLRGDSLVSATGAFGLSGRGATGTLAAVQASQEFWHSWKEFHPGTTKY